MLKFLVGFLVQGNFQASPACRLFPRLPPLFSVSQSSMRGENTDRMREIHLRSYTIQTHGAGLARKHTHDWVVLVFLAAVVLALHYAPPFSRFVGKDMMADIRYPVKQSTVPAWGFPIISILCPVVIFVSIYIARRDVYDPHHATLGVLFAVLITAVITDVIKNAVGRPRPDFFWRHFPDGKQLYDQVTGGVICHGEKSLLKDGRKSFPSGHTSYSFAGLGILSPYLSGKIKAFDRQGHVAKLHCDPSSSSCFA